MRLFVLTGDIQTGKTSWIKRMLERADAIGVCVAGLYTPAVFNDGEKTGIDLVLLPDGTRMSFARLCSPKKCRETGMKWAFDPDAFDRANEHLEQLGDFDLFLVDELGPVELLEGEGYTAALELLDSGNAPTALVVVRPSLLDAARDRWGNYELLTPDSDIDAFLESIM